MKRYRDRASEMRALLEIMTHPKTKASMLRLAHDYDDMADRVPERPAHDVTSDRARFPKTRNCRYVWEETRHPWVSLPPDTPSKRVAKQG